MNTPDEADLRQLLVERYGLSEPKITRIRTGGDGNQTFKIFANDTPFIARLYGEHGQQNPDWVQYELEMLTHLAANGISLAAQFRRFPLPNS